MTPEEKAQLNELVNFMNALKANATIPYEVDAAFRTRLSDIGTSGVPAGLANAPLSAITAPTGGVTVDSQARTAINTIISDLQTLGLTL